MVLCLYKRAEELPSVFNVTPKHAKHNHAAVEGAKALVSQDRAHIEQLLLVVNVHTALDLLLPHVIAATAIHDRSVCQVIRATFNGKRANLMLMGFLVNDLDEEKQVWPDEIAFRIAHFKEKDQMIGPIVFRDLHGHLECAVHLTLQLAEVRLEVDAKRWEGTAWYDLNIFRPLVLLAWIPHLPDDASMGTLALCTCHFCVHFGELRTIGNRDLSLRPLDLRRF